MAMIGKGIDLSNGGSGPGTYNALANIVDTQQPSKTFAKVDATEYASDFEVMIPGWLNLGEVPFKLNYAKNNIGVLNALLGVQGQYWKITLPDGGFYVFQGWLSKLGGNGPIKGVVTNDAIIVVTNIWAFTS